MVENTSPVRRDRSAGEQRRQRRRAIGSLPGGRRRSQSSNLRPVLTQYACPRDAIGRASVIQRVSAAPIFFGTPHVSAAKAGLLAYTRALAAELAPRKIRVNAIAPGTIDTDMVRNNPPQVQEAMAKASLLGRAAHPDEVVGLALYLASDASSFMTGATINIDGGLVPR